LAKVTALRVIAAVIGLIYSILVVRTFGVTSEVDSYFIAISIITILNKLLQTGQISELFLPIYLDIKNKNGPKEAQMVFFCLIHRFILVGFLMTLILITFAPLFINVIAAGFSQGNKQLAINIFRYSSPILLFSIISSFSNIVLNAEKVYGRAELTSFFSGITSIVIVYYFANTIGIYSVLTALIIGKILEFILGIVFLKRAGFNYYLVWTSKVNNLKEILGAYRFTSIYVGATQVFEIILNFSASFLPEGSLSLFKYTYQLSNKAHMILSGPFINIFFSEFKHKLLKQKINLLTYLTNPLMGAYIIYFFSATTIFLFGENILHVFWKNKNISLEKFKIAHIMLTFNFVGSISSVISSIFRKSVVSFGNAKYLYSHWSVVQILSAIYTYIIIDAYGVYGLATSAIFNMLFLSLATFKVAASTDIPVIGLGKLIFFEKKIFYFSLAHLIIVFILKNYIDSNIFCIVIIYAFLSTSLFLVYYKYSHSMKKNNEV